MDYYAHQTEDKSRKQTVKEHSENVGTMSRNFARPELGNLAELTGLLHDLGKFCIDFMKRLNGANVTVEHALGGAKELIKKYGSFDSAWIAAFCIAGHHSGLPDGGNTTDNTDDSTLLGRLQREVPNYEDYKKEITIPEPMSNEEFTTLVDKLGALAKNKNEKLEFAAFLTRYIYSCVVDADFLDTERFYNGEVYRTLKNDFEKCRVELLKYMGGFLQDTPIRIARNQLLEETRASIQEDAHIYFMNMPTGSGKTLCSMRAALDRMEKSKGTIYEKKRIIYVIPYSSIVEQTANTFENIFKDQPILQHHSNYCYEINSDIDDENNIQKRMKLASENWDSNGIIVTTNVQFFESLYHCRSSRMRKIHNMADSIIVFDEVHMMPQNYLEPCIKGVGYITKYLNSEAIFLTATMPDFKQLFQELIPFCKTVNLVSNRHEDVFKKCEYCFRNKMSEENIVSEIQEFDSTLIVVNNRKRASDLYNKIKSSVDAKVYHLSTYMTGYDRSKVIYRVKTILNNNAKAMNGDGQPQKVILVSTSLVEAGVDLDFKMAYREISGLDSVLQTGGRCNREGLYEGSVINVFEFEDSNIKNEIAIKANITKSLFKEYIDITSQECIGEYYYRFYGEIDEIKEQSITALKKTKKIKCIPFREYSERFRFIDSNTVGIVVNRDKQSEELIKKLKFENKSVARALQKYNATVYFGEFEKMLAMGIVDDYETGIFVLTNNDYYKDDVGIVLEDNKNYIG